MPAQRLAYLIPTLLILTAISASSQEALADATAQMRRRATAGARQFVENRGQWDARARFLARMPGVDAWVTDRGITYDFHREEQRPSLARVAAAPASELEFVASDRARSEERHRRGNVVSMRFLNSNGVASASPIHRTEGHHNYFIGNDPKHWASNVRLYEEVSISRIYEGIDARILFDDAGSMRYDLVIAPNADPSRVAMVFDGAESVRIGASGDLVIATSVGEVTQGKLVAYQDVHGARRRIDCRFAVDNRGNVGFVLGSYDRSKPLVIDPTLWSRYFGSSGEESGGSLAVDSVGNVYFTGTTASQAYPTRYGSYDISINGMIDAVVTRLNMINGSIGYSTFVGGAREEWVGRIVIDNAGCAYVALLNLSEDFPLTANAFDITYNGPALDAAVFKLDRSGGVLEWSTRLGGVGAEDALDIALDPDGSVLVSGTTTSTDFPTTAGVLYPSYMRGSQDGFVTRLRADGQQLTWSTYIGGSGIDVVTSVAVDSLGSVVVAGYTESTDFPVTVGSIQTVLAGQQDAFVTKINPSATIMIWSTFIGGTAHEGNAYIEVDKIGDVYMAGQTGSGDFPITDGAFDRIFAAMYAMRINSYGTAVHYSTFVGGPNDKVHCVALARGGFFLLTGFTTYTYFPTSADALSRTYRGAPSDAFVTIVRPSGATLSYSTYLGGSLQDVGYGIDLDRRGDVYVAGFTTSRNFPVQNSLPNGGTDLFITNIERCFVVAAAGADRTICQGDSVFIGNPAARGIPPYEYEWGSNGPDAMIDSVAQMWVKPTVSTIYIVTAADAIGCDDVDTVIITVNNPPVAIAGPDTSYCTGGSVKIGAPAVSGIPPYTYAWLPARGLSLASSPTPTARPDSTTEYVVTVTDSKGCVDRDTIVVRVNIPPVLEPGAAYEICARDTATIGVVITSGTPPFTYRWTPATGLSSTTAANPQAFPAATTSYRVTVSDSNGCSATSTDVIVTVGASLRARINTIGSLKLCPGDSVTLDAGEFAQYEWSTGETSRRITVGVPGTYSVGITSASGCTGRSDTVRVSLGERVDSSFTGAAVACMGSVTQYVASAGPGAIFQWRLAGMSGTKESETATGVINVRWDRAATDTLFLVVTSRDGCRDSSFSLITVTSAVKPVIATTPQIAMCPGDSVPLDAGGSYAKYKWSDGSTTQSIVARTAGTYWVEVEDALGCKGWSDTLEVQIRVAPLPEITALGTALCPGDTATLIATGGFAAYRWSNGATTDRVRIAAAGNYNVTVTDANGCVGTSADVAIVVHQQPGVPVITVSDDTLISSPAATYQWLRDDVEIAGATSQRLVRQLSGMYTVEITDSNGCHARSSIRIDERRNVWMDTVSAGVGERLRVGFIVSPGLTAANGVDGYRARLKIEPRDLFAHGVFAPSTNPGTPVPTMVARADGSIDIAYAGTQIVTGDTLFTLELQGLATARPASIVRIDSIVIAKTGEVSIVGNGLVLLSGCDVGAFATGKRVQLTAVRRDVGGGVIVSYRAPAGSLPSLRLYDAEGMLLLMVDLDTGTDGEQSASITIPASGFYVIELRDRAERVSLPMVIVK